MIKTTRNPKINNNWHLNRTGVCSHKNISTGVYLDFVSKKKVNLHNTAKLLPPEHILSKSYRTYINISFLLPYFITLILWITKMLKKK